MLEPQHAFGAGHLRPWKEVPMHVSGMFQRWFQTRNITCKIVKGEFADMGSNQNGLGIDSLYGIWSYYPLQKAVDR